jgi:hypothetical protein
VELTLSAEEEERLKDITQLFDAAESYHKKFKERAEHFYALYRNYQDFRGENRDWNPRDMDGGIRVAEREWGATLFIPYCFSTIETILPRMLSHRPRMLVLPRNQESEQNVENMRMLIDSQQEQIDYELVLEDIAKNGLIYGLGVQKTGWRKEVRTKRALEPTTYRTGHLERETTHTTFDDPYAEAVDPFDWLWDPHADSVEGCDFIFHRTWRSTRYVLNRLRSSSWEGEFSEEDVRMLRTGRYDEAQQGRRRIDGYGGAATHRDQPHEVWEFHDGERVTTVLDRRIIVQEGPNPTGCGEFPFQVFRPSSISHHMVGIGAIEPVEDLQAEMNTLRSQRRDNATLKLQQVFAYRDGLVDPADLKFGPGMAMPVEGDPRELLFPINVGDIPNSGYQEEANLQADIERTTGISDPVTGSGEGGGSSQTATGVQLVQAAANTRIQRAVRRLEVEVIKPGARQWIALNQRKILEPREIGVPAPPNPMESYSPGQPDRRYMWFQLGPDELRGEMAVEPEGGATAPENIAQNRQDAQLWMQMFGQNPMVEPRMVLKRAIEGMGIRQPDAYLKPPEPRVPPAILDILAQRGVDQGLIQQAWDEATQAETNQSQPGQGPQNEPEDGIEREETGEPKPQPEPQGQSSNGREPARSR